MADRLTVSVLVPWRPDGADRDRAWSYVQCWWAEQHPDWQVVTGACPDGPWRKATAVADALARADGDLLVVADADVICAGIGEAAAQVQAGAGWAIPHRKVHRLTATATEAVYTGAQPADVLGGLARKPYLGVEGGGLVMLPRTAYMEAPLDPRFETWGQDDESWAVALRSLVGPPWRGTADLWHLWHEPAERLNRHVGNKDGWALHIRYQLAAKEGPAAVRQLLNEIVAVGEGTR